MTLDERIKRTKVNYSDVELTLGFLRFEAVRKLNPSQYSELCVRNLKGENFDQMIDELITKGKI